MKNSLSRFALIAALALASTAALADSFKDAGMPFKDVTIKDIKNGKLIVEINTNDRSYDLAAAGNLEFTSYPKLAAAENARAEPTKAADLYKAAIASLSGGKKRVAQARAIPIFEETGRFTDAVNAFLDVYQHDPSDGTWALRPKKLPDASSTLLKDAAATIQGKINSVPAFKTGDPNKNLYNFLLEIYVKAGDTAKTAEISKKLNIATPSGESPTPETPTVAANTGSETPAASAVVSGTLNDLDAAMNAKSYDKALAIADSMLPAAREDTAVRLFKTKAQAYTALKKYEDAIASYVRIPAHYPSNREVPEALYAAAELQCKLAQDAANEIDAEAKKITDKNELKAYFAKPEVQAKLKHADAAQALITQLGARYKDSAAAVKANRLEVKRPTVAIPQ